MDNVFRRHAEVAAHCRKRIAELGLSLWTAPDAVNSPTVTAVNLPVGISWPRWKQALLERDLAITGSFGPMAGKVFRIGHMGTQAHFDLVDAALDVIAGTLHGMR